MNSGNTLPRVAGKDWGTAYCTVLWRLQSLYTPLQTAEAAGGVKHLLHGHTEAVRAVPLALPSSSEFKAYAGWATLAATVISYHLSKPLTSCCYKVGGSLGKGRGS